MDQSDIQQTSGVYKLNAQSPTINKSQPLLDTSFAWLSIYTITLCIYITWYTLFSCNYTYLFENKNHFQCHTNILTSEGLLAYTNIDAYIYNIFVLFPILQTVPLRIKSCICWYLICDINTSLHPIVYKQMPFSSPSVQHDFFPF